MFLRLRTHKKKSGAISIYPQIIETKRNPLSQKIKVTLICHLGRLKAEETNKKILALFCLRCKHQINKLSIPFVKKLDLIASLYRLLPQLSKA